MLGAWCLVVALPLLLNNMPLYTGLPDQRHWAKKNNVREADIVLDSSGMLQNPRGNICILLRSTYLRR